MSAGNDLTQIRSQQYAPTVVLRGIFAQITIIDKSGRQQTYKEYIEELRKYYLAHPPRGINRKRILEMSEEKLEDMADIMDEISNDTWEY